MEFALVAMKTGCEATYRTHVDANKRVFLFTIIIKTLYITFSLYHYKKWLPEKFIGCSLVPRSSHHPVFDGLQHAKMEGRPGSIYHVSDVNV